MDILYVDQTRSIVEKVNDFYNWTHSLSGMKQKFFFSKILNVREFKMNLIPIMFILY